MKNKTVWIMIEDTGFYSPPNELMAFSSKEKLLDYWRKLYPEKKNLRLKKIWDNEYSLLNHNAHFRYDLKIFEAELNSGEGIHFV